MALSQTKAIVGELRVSRAITQADNGSTVQAGVTSWTSGTITVKGRTY